MKCDFRVVGMKEPPSYFHTDRISYAENLGAVRESKAILEVCIKGQSANTLRALEAITYDKILITNNERIKESKFYNPKKIIIFRDIEDIKRLKLADIMNDFTYGYIDEYSPCRILEDISG